MHRSSIMVGACKFKESRSNLRRLLDVGMPEASLETESQGRVQEHR